MRSVSGSVAKMMELLTRNWWLLLVRGIFAIAFGCAIVALDPFFPVPFVREITFAVLAVLFGLFALACGLLTSLASIRSFSWVTWALLADGLAISVAGLLVLVLPGLTLREVMYMIACAALLAGIAEIAVAAGLRRTIKHEWLLMTSGIGSAAFGIYLAVAAEYNLTSVLRATCVYALVSGLAITAFAIRLRKLPLQRRAAAA